MIIVIVHIGQEFSNTLDHLGKHQYDKGRDNRDQQKEHYQNPDNTGKTLRALSVFGIKSSAELYKQN